MEEIPEELATLIHPVLGRWFGDRIDLVGDYTKNAEYEDLKENDEEYDDISETVATAVFAVMACDVLKGEGEDKKKEFLELLERKVRSRKSWENETCVKPILSFLDTKKRKHEDE